MNPSQLQPLLPHAALDIPAELSQSLNRFGCIAPILIQGDRIVDGIKRWQCMTSEERGAAPIQVAVTSSPYQARWLANATRQWNPVETALVFHGLNEDVRQAFCANRQFSPTPNLVRSFELITASPDLWPELIRGVLPLSVWRDLGNISDGLSGLFRLILSIHGTVGEKRLLAALLKQAWLKHRLPEFISPAPAIEIIRLLQQLLSPRREEVQRRLDVALKSIDFPPRVELETDPVFEKAGVSIKLHIRRHETGKLQQLQAGLERLFEQVPEL